MLDSHATSDNSFDREYPKGEPGGIGVGMAVSISSPSFTQNKLKYI